MIDVVEFVKQLVNILQQFSTFILARYNAVYKLVMFGYNLLELLLERLVTIYGQLGSLDKFVGYATKSRYNNNYILLYCSSLNDAFQIQYTVYGTYRCSAEFHYFHQYFLFACVIYANIKLQKY